MSDLEVAHEGSVRVLVADDQQLMRDGIASLLGIQEGIEVVGLAANGEEAVEQAIRLRPDVVLMDVRMPIMNGVAATGHLRRDLPSCKILMLTTFDDETYVLEALRVGASGYLLKDIPTSDLVQAIQAVHRGIYQLDPAVMGRVIAALPKPEPEEPPVESLRLHQSAMAGSASSHAQPGDLTDREIEVVRLIAQGATNREIAEQLVISEGTVKNHISNILSRLGLRDRTQAAIYAREQHLL
jgi:DNA-binding NarL/FixJ family response regulator